MIKTILKSLLPPIVFNIIKTNKQKNTNENTRIVWEGNYPSWREAMAVSDGYDASFILEKVKTAILKVKNGEAVYERDSVLFDTIQYSWGLLAGLQKAAIEHNLKLSVLDFGGSLGSSYFQNKHFLNNLNSIEWSVVEQPHFVECGKTFIEDNELKFYHTIDDCLQSRKPNVLLLSGVLQCVKNPYQWIDTFLQYNIPYIIIDRTAFTNGLEDILTVQHVPQSIYRASYPAWFFNPKKLMDKFKASYEVIASFDSGFTPPVSIMSTNAKGYWSGYILKRK